MKPYKHRTGGHRRGPDFWVPILAVVAILIMAFFEVIT